MVRAVCVCYLDRLLFDMLLGCKAYKKPSLFRVLYVFSHSDSPSSVRLFGLSTRLSVCPSACLSVFLSIRLSVCLSDTVLVLIPWLFLLFVAEIVLVLLEKDASLEARNKDKATPLDSSHNKQVSL